MTNRFQTLLLAAGSVAALSGGFASSAHAQVELSIACGAVGIELELCREGTEAWAAETGNTVEIVSTPDSASERLALYQQILSAEADDIDVYQIDVIWPGILGSHFVDLSQHIEQDQIDEHFDAIVENNTVDGEIVAMPWFTDAGVLYYRTDLAEEYDVEPPTTWQELTEAAEIIQAGEREKGNDRFWGYVWQGRAYEGLTCNALEWFDSFNGGTIVADDGSITINNDANLEALELASSWIGTISPNGVLNYMEEDARGVFQSGNAAFMRNWPYAWALAQSDDSEIRGNVGVLPLPMGGDDGQHTGTLGGWNLAVSRYSDNTAEAADLVAYLVSMEEQKRRAIVGGYNPTIGALYDDEDVLEANPFFGELYDTFVNAVARPSAVTAGRYNEVSSAFYNAVHDALSGGSEASEALSTVEAELQRMSRGGRW
ncbi:ABC transporter substrate-binding protein [Fodinicurvata sp. EGI_FJ10296]|uniref:ABC transporter substrate-binding protein n=1 Tax=Fodinicurvata sp. EGI_FJ10296 TaxID=3231908 RepID=UPI0034530921